MSLISVNEDESNVGVLVARMYGTFSTTTNWHQSGFYLTVLSLKKKTQQLNNQVTKFAAVNYLDVQ